jgi:acyl-CoA thioesterase-2
MSVAKPALLDLLALEEPARDVFRAETVFADPINLYGGQVAAQALRAAGMTVEKDRAAPHSMHCYFLRAGDPTKPVDYFVHRDRDGRSYSARTVSAMQEGRELLIMSASFHVTESGPDAQGSILPALPKPDEAELKVVDARTCDIDFLEATGRSEGDVIRQVWTKSAVNLGNDPLLHACVVTYISDMFTGLFTLVPRRNDLALNSLDHAIWFLRPAKADNWMFMQLHGESLNDGRGLYSGEMFDANGALIAKLMQESLFRPRAPKR